MKISFHSYAYKTNFHMKSFAHSLAFIVRFTTTWKWPIGWPFLEFRTYSINSHRVSKVRLIDKGHFL